MFQIKIFTSFSFSCGPEQPPKETEVFLSIHHSIFPTWAKKKHLWPNLFSASKKRKTHLSHYPKTSVDPIYALHPKKEKKLSHLLHPWAHLLQLDPITILHLQQDFFPDFTFNPTLPPLLTGTLLSVTLFIYLINQIPPFHTTYYTNTCTYLLLLPR